MDVPAAVGTFAWVWFWAVPAVSKLVVGSLSGVFVETLSAKVCEKYSRKGAHSLPCSLCEILTGCSPVVMPQRHVRSRQTVAVPRPTCRGVKKECPRVGERGGVKAGCMPRVSVSEGECPLPKRSWESLFGDPREKSLKGSSRFFADLRGGLGNDVRCEKCISGAVRCS